MSDEELAELVIKAKTPSVRMLGDNAELWIAPNAYPISMDQADLLYRTMFFRGSL